MKYPSFVIIKTYISFERFKKLTVFIFYPVSYFHSFVKNMTVVE